MSSETAPDLNADAASDDEGRRTTLIIAAAAGATAMSFNVWYPILPLYALDLGAKSDADAVAWVALAITLQGVGRLASSAVWGFLSDRWGRKLMLLRALYLASITFGFAAAAQAPWHLSIALACQGMFSGFIPASVALVSVSVPDHRLNRSLSTVTGAQYLGTTSGPALGALLSLVFNFRATIMAAAFIPVIMATVVLLFVPRDEVRARKTDDGQEVKLEPFKVSRQFVLGVAFLFSVYAMNELIRLSTPIALKDLRDGADAATASLITFSLGGLVSAVGVLLLAPMVFRTGALRRAFGAACAFGAGGFLVLALTNSIPLYILGFMMIAVVISSLVPAINTHIASSVPRSRRGTGFGIAATAQALSFAVGPGGAAFFAAVSLHLGFTVIAALFISLGLVMFSAIREQQLASA